MRQQSRPFLYSSLSLALSGLLFLTGCQKPAEDKTTDAETTTTEQAEGTTNASAELTGSNEEKLLTSYANMAEAAYQDSLDGAKKLQAAIDTFVADPTQANLDAAKAAYKEARQPYSQTEVFRFDEGFVTADDKRAIESVDGWEGQVNAWPLDEALIDYVNDNYEGEYNSKDNIINSNEISVGSTKQDTSNVTPELLAEMNEIGGSEANVTTGYHAIEFLLWGQDTNGVGEGAGTRPVSDYMTEDGKCTSGDVVNPTAAICKKRGEYLKAAAQLLVTDLTDMVAQWKPDTPNTLRSDLMARADSNAVRQIMYQMGSLALGELASERMQVAFVTGSTEDEHECFSDLTHLSYANNARGIDNVFNGGYKTVAGATVGGYGVKQYLVDAGHEDEANQLGDEFKKVQESFDVIVDKGENDGIKVDQMIATVGQAAKHDVSAEEQNLRRGWIESAINNLQALTASIEKSANSIGIDNLDADSGSQFSNN
ncbi:imelysin family protein [Psychrobacter sp. I-STPA6b]|uniref:imelysin family protein n=1 Tax=Psychrobacter sp. I-STPA6b TaxID=2585718 RepID=UPI001D0CC7FF|nr:imelysin family protein [Psychrobacter sp. I-STPA6b]